MGNPGEAAKDTPSERVRVKPDVFMAAQLIEMNDHLANLEDILSGKRADAPCEDLTCNLVVTKKGAEGTVPPPAPAPAPSPELPPAPVDHFAEMNKILAQNNKVLGDLYEVMQKISAMIATTSGFGAVKNYYTQGLTAVSVATPNVPPTVDTIADPTTTPGTPGYDVVPINTILGRNANLLTVSADGTDTLFVVSSQDGKTFTPELQVQKGEYRRFFDVYELRIRSPSAGIINKPVIVGGIQRTTFNQGGIYRIVEFATESALVNINRTAVFITAATVLTAPFMTIFFITLPLVNTTSAFRASVLNTDTVYATYQGGDVGNVTQRITLNPGDAFRVNVTQGLQIGFRGASPGQIIELLTESDVV